MSNKYKHNSGSVYNVKYHLVWCPKYRRKVLIGQIETRLKELLYEKASKLSIEIETIEIMPDHVHVFITGTPMIAIQHIMNQLKGYSSRILRNEFKELRSRLPTLWSRSYYVGTVGHVNEETVKKYIEEQKGK